MLLTSDERSRANPEQLAKQKTRRWSRSASKRSPSGTTLSTAPAKAGAAIA